MEAQGSRWRQLPVLLLWVNGLMTLGFAGAHQQTELCNESLMLEKLPTCGKSFEEMMKKVDSKKWCNLTEFIISVEYPLHELKSEETAGVQHFRKQDSSELELVWYELS
ncbi:receptor activity-modifying protein 3 isoform X3 [Prinia subflava]|uniref:receptor activity-modifying protein 3 isoform X3 n=1 Tax=Prinia subflava TaxID=208062 RepID=UPI002FE421AB